MRKIEKWKEEQTEELDILPEFHQCLIKRVQVRIGTNLSDSSEMRAGLPQSPELSSKLYSIYNVDIPKSDIP